MSLIIPFTPRKLRERETAKSTCAWSSAVEEATVRASLPAMERMIRVYFAMNRVFVRLFFGVWHGRH